MHCCSKLDTGIKVYLTKKDLAEFEGAKVLEDKLSSFAYSFYVLPKYEKNAILSVYSFCSYIDDIFDAPAEVESVESRLKRLLHWREIINRLYEGEFAENCLLSPLSNVIAVSKIPKQYFFTLIEGCKRDLVQNRYETFEDLKAYCYGVAGIVGLICIEIFGYKYEETKNYAVNLGYALQLTNIIRDVSADLERDYVYLPQEDLRSFDVTEDDLKSGNYNDNFVELMRFEVSRARDYYHKARTLLHPDERVSIYPAEIMDAIYYRLLEKIELKEYRIFNRRIRVSTSHKLYMALKHYLQSYFLVKRLKNSAE